MEKVFVKRAKISLILFIILSLGVLGRLAVISEGGYKKVAAAQSRYTVTLDEIRGTVFDRGMINITNAKSVCKASMVAAPNTISAVYEFFDDVQASQITELLKNGLPLIRTVPEGFHADGTTVVKTFERYSSDNAAAHIIGYLDPSGQKGISGIESAFDSVLKSRGGIKLSYTCDAVGNVLYGIPPAIDAANYGKSGYVQLTISLPVQRAAEEALKASGMVGSIVVVEAGTGEILAMASAPSFSPNDLESALNNEDSPFLNRALLSYNVGSVFKLCVAAAAIEAGYDVTAEYTCTGSIDCGQSFACHKKDGHGAVNMEEAIAYSCNTYFINLARKVGARAIYEMAQKLGFGDIINLCDGMTSKGNLPDVEIIEAVPASLANFAIGQGELLASPLQIANMINIIAGGGISREITLIKSVCDENGNKTDYTNESKERVMNSQTAGLLMQMMKSTVSSGTGQKGKPETGGAGGKTATAQTGILNSRGQSVAQAWFAGFYPAENPKYAVSILCEDASSGSVDAAPIFKAFCDNVSKVVQN